MEAERKRGDASHARINWRIKREENWLMGYEPYFEKNVRIASIDEEEKIIRPTHGYYPNHPHSKKAIAWAKRNGYKYIADAFKTTIFLLNTKTYQGGGEVKYMVWVGDMPLDINGREELTLEEAELLKREWEEKGYVANIRCNVKIK